jgi:RNA polymerase sigma-70 factor, ECF subfamily
VIVVCYSVDNPVRLAFQWNWNPTLENPPMNPPQDDAATQRVAAALLAHRQRLWRLVHFRLHNSLQGRVDAEDVLQEAYIDACHRAEHFPEDGTEYIWLRLIVLQTLADTHRRHLGAKKRSVAREVHGVDGSINQTTSISIVGRLLGHLTSPSQAAIREELGSRLRQAIEAMGELDAEVLALRHFEELSNQEVANVLNITEKTASIRYVRALQRLRVLVQEIPDFDFGGKDL